MADDDYLTDASSSLYDSSAPVTPRDFSSTLEQDLDMLFNEDTYEVPQYSAPELSDRTFLSESKFFIPDDDEEESLPPLDDWYISIANRCMPPEEAIAVAAAAAMTVSCQWGIILLLLVSSSLASSHCIVIHLFVSTFLSSISK